MKKTVTVNLSGIVYHIDDDAYQMLNEYLNSLNKALRNEADRDEIISDIESRISELFSSRINNGKQVINVDDIYYVIETLGTAELIGGERTTSSEGAYGSRTGNKRMYRDPEGRMIGGVCSGLAAYWNTTPTIVRIIFVLLMFVASSGLLIYLVLWLVLPEAITDEQKQEMRGESVTFESIKDFLTREFEYIKDKFKDKRRVV